MLSHQAKGLSGSGRLIRSTVVTKSRSHAALTCIPGER